MAYDTSIAVLCLTCVIPFIRGKCLLPLGDSITQADSYHASWRYHLWKMLIDARLNYSWTGSMIEHSGGAPAPHLQPEYSGNAFPAQHEGHSSWKIDDVLSNTEDQDSLGSGNIHQWLVDYECKPTCTLIHLGTNDICMGDSVESTRAELRELVTVLKSATDSTIVLAVPIPVGDAANCCHRGNLSLLTPLIETLENQQERVFVVRQDVGFTSTDLYDCYHPDMSGEIKMAQVWFDAIQEHCLDTTTTTTSTLTITAPTLTTTSLTDATSARTATATSTSRTRTMTNTNTVTATPTRTTTTTSTMTRTTVDSVSLTLGPQSAEDGGSWDYVGNDTMEDGTEAGDDRSKRNDTLMSPVIELSSVQSRSDLEDDDDGVATTIIVLTSLIACVCLGLIALFASPCGRRRLNAFLSRPKASQSKAEGSQLVQSDAGEIDADDRLRKLQAIAEAEALAEQKLTLAEAEHAVADEDEWDLPTSPMPDELGNISRPKSLSIGSIGASHSSPSKLEPAASANSQNVPRSMAVANAIEVVVETDGRHGRHGDGLAVFPTRAASPGASLQYDFSGERDTWTFKDTTGKGSAVDAPVSEQARLDLLLTRWSSAGQAGQPRPGKFSPTII